MKRYEEQRKGNKSTYWVIFELTWRDYYRYFTMSSGNAIFLEYGITNRKVGLICSSSSSSHALTIAQSLRLSLVLPL